MKASIETIEKNNIEQSCLSITEKLDSLHDKFESGFSPDASVFMNAGNLLMKLSVRDSFGIEESEMTPEVYTGAVNTVKHMYSGIDIDGRKSLGLKEISSWKINDACREANINQHAGFAAEVISTEKENFYAKLHNTGDVTYRADDLPSHLREQLRSKGVEIAAKNDQYVDKVRFKSDGTIEKVQTKFVGNDARSCLKKLMSEDYEKYLEDGKVDKIEIPKEFNKDLQSQIKADKKALCKQYAKIKDVSEKAADAEKIKNNIDKLDKLKEKVEASNVTKADAKLATEHPKLYAAKQINNQSLKQGAKTAAFTAAISGVSNYEKYKDGEISGKEAVENVVKDAAIAGGIAYGTEVVTQLTGGSSVPGAVITMGVESYGDVKGYIDGDISGEQLAYNLGENAASIIGGAIGGAAGGTLGSVAGPVGTFAGSTVGAGAGSKAARDAYRATVEFIADNADDIKNAADELGENIIETANDIKDAASENASLVGDKAKAIAGDATETISDIKDVAGEKFENAADKADELKKAAVAKISGVFNN